MRPVAQVLLKPSASMLEVIQVIEKGAMQIALVVDGDARLLGTVTDGDVRRGLLRGMSMDTAVSLFMNTRPYTVLKSDGPHAANKIMSVHGLRQIPVVSASGVVLGIEHLDELGKRKSWVVLMAGGLGTRLRPLTETTPKPLIPIGGRPLIEGIIASFADQGFERFFICLNYKPDLFREHFGDGSKLGVSIEYIQETEPRGTAGALALLPEKPTAPLVVMNGDLLTSVKFDRLIEFHEEHSAAGTMCIRQYNFQVPFGVVETESHRFIGVVEKPTQTYFVNAGIYALDPDALAAIPSDRPYNMTELFADLATARKNVAVFPLREYWLDVGRFEDLERAQAEYNQVFVL